MRKLVKFLGISVGVVLIVLVGAVLIVPVVVDPNDYKAAIIDRVKDLTGRDLTINGDISLSLFPWLGVDLAQASLSNAEGFGTQSFVSTERIQVRVKVIPLLQGAAQMDTILVDGLTLNLARNAQGKTNFDDLLITPRGEATQGGTPIAALAIGGIKLSESTITWRDALTEHQSTVGNLSLDTGPLSLDDPIEFDLAFDVQSSQPSLSGRVALSATVGFDPDTQIVIANQVSLKTSVQSPLFPGGPIPFEVAGNAIIDLKSQTVTLGDLLFSASELEIDSGVRAKLTATGTIEGHTGNGRYQSQELLVEGGIEGEDVPGGMLPFKLRTDFDVNLADESLAMHAFQLDNAIADLTGTALVTQLLSAPQAEGELDMAPFNVRAMLKRLGLSVPDTTDQSALTSLELHTSFRANDGKVALNSLNVKLDDTSLTGNVAIVDFATRALRIDLNVDRLNADRYRPRNAPEASPGAGAVAAGSLPLETLRTLDVDGKLALGTLKVNHLDLDNVGVSLRAKAGLIELSPLRAELYGGTYEGNLALDARGDQARVVLDEKLTGVQLGTLLSALSVDTAEMDLSDAVGDVAIKANITGDLGQQRFNLTDASVTTHVTGSAIPGGKLLAAAKADLMLDVSKQLVSADSVSLAVNNLRVPSGIRTTGVLGANTITARLDAGSYSVSGLNIDLKALQLNPKANSTPLKLLVSELHTDLNHHTLSADSFDVSLLGLKANGKVTITNLVDNPQLTGVLDVTSLNPKQLLPVFGLPTPTTADPNALTSAVVQTTFKASRNSLTLRPLSLQLDATQINGAVEVADIEALKGINFDLEATRLNADGYLPPKTTGQASTPGAAASAIPLDVIRHLDVKGQLKIDQLIISNLTLTDINLTVTGKDGMLTMDPLGAVLYGGRYTGNVALDGQGKAAKLNINEALENVHIGPLLRDVTGQQEKLTGRGGLRIQASATGLDTDQMIRTLTGQTALLLQDGSIKGIDIVNTICNLVSGGAGGETRFSDMTASGQIRNGVVDSRDLKVKSPLLRAGGGGLIDLVRAQIDYLAKVSLVGTCQGQGGLALQDLSGIHIPVAITGALEHPKFKPDLGAVLAQGLQKGLGGKLEETLGIKGLGGLLGGGTHTQTQGNEALETQDQPTAQPKAKEDPLKKLGKDLLKGLFQ